MATHCRGANLLPPIMPFERFEWTLTEVDTRQGAEEKARALCIANNWRLIMIRRELCSIFSAPRTSWTTEWSATTAHSKTQTLDVIGTFWAWIGVFQQLDLS